MNTNGDPRREEARRLRVDPGLSPSELMRHVGVGSATLTDWLRGIEPPEWTRRPNAKDHLRNEAVELRKLGWSIPRPGRRGRRGQVDGMALGPAHPARPGRRARPAEAGARRAHECR